MKVVNLAKVRKEPLGSPLFTGPDVTAQAVVGPELSKTFQIRQVNFGPGTRNKFHSHTSDQVLIVTEGHGTVATERKTVSVGPGDVVFIPAGESHWHGAAPGSSFSHLYVVLPDSSTTQLEQ